MVFGNVSLWYCSLNGRALLGAKVEARMITVKLKATRAPDHQKKHKGGQQNIRKGDTGPTAKGSMVALAHN